jgi:CheY-like chemotaxis protein
MTTILLADDKKNIRNFCKQELEDEGYQVILACDGREAIERVQEKPIDLVILDLCMPRLSGLEAIEPIRAIVPEVPIILFTANDEDCLTDVRSQYAAACVEKSEDLTELKRAIVRTLAMREGKVSFRSGLPPIES